MIIEQRERVILYLEAHMLSQSRLNHRLQVIDRMPSAKEIPG